jgi:hypothetical protein
LLVMIAMCSVGASSASAVTLGLNWSGSYAEGESVKEMNIIRRSGATVFRQQMSMGYKGAHGWGPYDAVFGLAAERGITILPYLYGRANGSGQFPVSSEYAAYENWVYEVVNRYGYGGDFWVGKPYARPVDIWEIWNEPNLAGNNPGGATVQPKLFGNFFKRMSNALKAAQQARAPGHVGTQVLLGGLMNVPTGTGAIDNYLKGVNEEPGATAAYDGLGLHPYEFGSANHIADLDATLSGTRWILDNVVPAKGKPIWVTELGWPVTKGTPPLQQVTEAEQATLLTESLDLIKSTATKYNIPLAIWYNYRDLPDPGWSYGSGLRNQDGFYRPAWWAYQAETGAGKWPMADELGFVALKTSPKNVHIDTYAPGPTYKSLLSSSDTGYPGIAEPSKAQALAIDTNGDGTDELGFLALTNPGNVHLDTYKGAPEYKTLASNCNTAYPTVADPSKLQALALDVNGDGIDELGFAALSSPGNVHLDVYTNPPCYSTLLSSSDTGYPTIPDPSKAQALAIDTNGDGTDELGFLALTNPGNVHLTTYSGAPGYKTLASNCDTGYPTIAEPKYAEAMAMDWNGDGTDELGFLAYKTATGATHLDGYVGGPCYTTLSSNSDTAYPSVSSPENLQALALNVNTTAYDPPPVWGVEKVAGGAFAGDPDIASWGAGRLDIVTRGTDNGLWQKGFQSPTWYPWNKIGSGLTSGPGAVSWGPGRIDVVARTDSPAKENVQHWWYDQSAGVWNSDNRGGVVTSDPDISSWGVGRLDIFANGTDNAVKHQPFYSGAWAGWDALPVEAMASAPSAVSWGSGRIDVVAKTAAGTVKHWWYDASAGVWNSDNLGGNITSAPDISSWGPNRLDVFAKGPENSLVHKYWWGGGWSAWESLGGTIVSGPGAVSWGANHIDVVARGTDNNIYRWTYVDP